MCINAAQEIFYMFREFIIFLYEWNQSTFSPFNNMALISMALPAT